MQNNISATILGILFLLQQLCRKPVTLCLLSHAHEGQALKVPAQPSEEAEHSSQWAAGTATGASHTYSQVERVQLRVPSVRCSNIWCLFVCCNTATVLAALPLSRMQTQQAHASLKVKAISPSTG